jgi:oligopeptide/dipeptide ABC transporter ATP-binding protein
MSSNETRQPLLQVRDLKTQFKTEAGWAKAVDGVSFDIFPGEVVGLVGESGSGKSVTALSVIRLIPDPPGKIVGGSAMFNGRDLLKLSWEELRQVRGNDISVIFQEPMTSLNPVMTIGSQLTEVVLQHAGTTKKDAFDRSVAALDSVGIPAASSRMKDYPHHFSGGMRQRVMIAMALVCNPALLIADEPTTALDVTIQAQILDLMLKLRDERKGAGILLITHNLAVVAETCDRVIVMYGGKIQETGSVHDIFKNPLHPYTKGLLSSLPSVAGARETRLQAIPGVVPGIFELPVGCKFETRCSERIDKCAEIEPELLELAPRHWVRCHVAAESPLR